MPIGPKIPGSIEFKGAVAKRMIVFYAIFILIGVLTDIFSKK